MKAVCGRYALYGAGAFLTYQLTYDLMRHHDEANTRPLFLDHTVAITIIGTGVGAMIVSHPHQLFMSTFFSIVFASPATWWLFKH